MKISRKEIHDVIRQIIEERGLKPRYSKAEIIDQYITNNNITTEEWKNTWRQWGKLTNQEEKAEKNIREVEEHFRNTAAELIDEYRKAGLLDEDEED